MTDRKQFEAMLEALINEDQESAKEIFHNIVVAKSREIYEELLAEDFDLEEGPEDGVEAPVEEPAVEAFGDEEETDDEEGSDDEVGGDAGDDFVSDVDGEEDGEDLSDEEQTDRILDLEDALEQLKSEFEQLMAGEEGEEHMGGDDMGGMDDMDAMGGDEFGGDMGGDEIEDESVRSMFEYVDKVSLPKHGDNGVNTKSIIAKKNDMGGTTANIAKNFSTEKGGTQGGLLKPTAKVEDFGNINKPGANAGKTAFKKKEPGHGAEKKATGDNGDRGADSLLNKVSSRAK
jgi:hypothetical protein